MHSRVCRRTARCHHRAATGEDWQWCQDRTPAQGQQQQDACDDDPPGNASTRRAAQRGERCDAGDQVAGVSARFLCLRERRAGSAASTTVSTTVSTGGATGDDTGGGSSVFGGIAGGGSSGGSNGRRARRMIGYNVFIHSLRVFAVGSDGGVADGDLLPVRAIADRQTRHAASPAGRKVNDAARELRRRDTSGDRRGDVGVGRHLNLLTREMPCKTARNFFAHKLRCDV